MHHIDFMPSSADGQFVGFLATEGITAVTFGWVLWVFFKYIPKSWTADPVGTVISFLRNLHNVLCSDSYQVPSPPTA